MPRGGTRPGAGRKSKAEKYERPINRAEKQIVDRLPDLVDNLLKLADGGYETGTETLEPAGMVFVGEGEARTLAFPHLDPAQLVVVKQTRSIAVPDLRANTYLVDRILGRPTERQEIEQDHSGEVRVRVEYADPDPAAAA